MKVGCRTNRCVEAVFGEPAPTVHADVVGAIGHHVGAGVRLLRTRLHLEEEYARYGVPHLRVVSGSLQLLGATGVALGLVEATLGTAAAAGLCLMMVLGVGVRVGVHDPVRAMVPAASLAVINGALVYLFATQ